MTNCHYDECRVFLMLLIVIIVLVQYWSHIHNTSSIFATYELTQ
jgi:hypothetical protein